MIRNADFFIDKLPQIAAVYAYRTPMDNRTGSMVRMQNGEYYRCSQTPEDLLDRLGAGYWIRIADSRKHAKRLQGGKPVALMLDRDTMALEVKSPYYRGAGKTNYGFVLLPTADIHYLHIRGDAETGLAFLSRYGDAVAPGNSAEPQQRGMSSHWIPTGMTVRCLKEHISRAWDLYREYHLEWNRRK